MLDRRILVVTGKGGVGKTTVSVALALRAAAAGLKVMVCETSGADQVPQIFSVIPRPYEVQSLAPRLSSLSITSEAAIEDYIVQQLRFRRIYQMVFRNRIVGPFMDAVPGLHDLITLGKVWDLERRKSWGRPEWDLLIVDAPATGHGLSLLGSPRGMMDLTVAGPFYENAKLIADLFDDPARTGIVLVSLPEEMPVNETLDLYERLGPMRQQVLALALNNVYPEPLEDAELYRRHRPLLAQGANDAGLQELRLMDRALVRARREHRAKERLQALSVPLVELPAVWPAHTEHLGRGLRVDDLPPLVRALGPICGDPA